MYVKIFSKIVILIIMNNKYIPGVCNIGPKEMAFRKSAGIAGLALTILFLILEIIFKLSTPFKLLVFIPIFLTSISFLQYKMHFCAEFGILGKFNFTDELGHVLSVEQKEYLKLDRIKAAKIILYSFVISIILTVAVVVLL